MMVETNIDDMTPEKLGVDFQNDLLAKGALDFFLTAVQMKKGRPGWKLSVLVAEANLNEVNAYILENTSSIGVRYYPVARTILERRQIEVETKFGPIKVKQVITPSGAKRHKIEYESLRSLDNKGLNLQLLERELYAVIQRLDL